MSQINPTLPTSGDPRGGEELDLLNALAALLAEFNGNIDATNLKDGAVPAAKLAAGAVTLAKQAVVPAARVYNNAAISIPSAVLTALTFNSERYDTATIHDNAVNPGRLTCPATGLYMVGANVEFAANNAASSYRLLELRLNGTTKIASDNAVGKGNFDSVPIRLQTNVPYALSAGDYVEVMVQHDVALAVNVVVDGNASPEAWMYQLGRIA